LNEAAAVASQPTLDFKSGGNVTFAVANDAANNRVTVSASVPSQVTPPPSCTVGTSFPSPTAVGQQFFLIGSHSRRLFVWNGSNWWSEVIPVVMNTVNTPITQTDIGSPTIMMGGGILSFTDELAAGCAGFYARISGRARSAPTKQGYFRLGYAWYAANGTAGGWNDSGGGQAQTYLADGSTPEILEGTWVGFGLPGGYNGVGFGVYGWRDGGGSGASIIIYEATAMVSFYR
jgi:hypothetical protein